MANRKAPAKKPAGKRHPPPKEAAEAVLRGERVAAALREATQADEAKLRAQLAAVAEKADSLEPKELVKYINGLPTYLRNSYLNSLEGALEPGQPPIPTTPKELRAFLDTYSRRALKSLRGLAGTKWCCVLDTEWEWARDIQACDSTLPTVPVQRQPRTFRGAQKAIDTLLGWCEDSTTRQKTGGAGGAVPSPDFSSVNWFGTPYTFNQSQATAVALLWGDQDKPSGLTLRERMIGEKLKTTNHNFRLAHTFRNRDGKMHPAWGNMIKAATRGCYRLAVPESQ